MKFKFRLTENIYSGKNSNNEINKRKHKRSMSPFVSLNAGDVEKSIDVFNKGFGDDCSTCGESVSIGEALNLLEDVKDSDIIDDIILELKPGLDYLED